MRALGKAIIAAFALALAAGGAASAQSDAFERAARRIERGDLDGARAALEDVTSPSEVLLVLVDRRFEPLWDEFQAATGGPRGAVERTIAAAEERRAAEPRKLEAVIDHMMALRDAGRAAEAVAVGESVLPQLAGEDPAYSDLRDYATWFLDVFADCLADVGRMDEAHATMAAASEQRERYMGYVFDHNISQLLNRGMLLAMDAKPQEALDLAAEARRLDLSRYGSLVLVQIEVCARAQLGPTEAAALEQGLETLRSQRRSSPGAYQNALHCAGRTDEARELMIWRLETEDHRLDALRNLQDFTTPYYLPPFRQRRADVWRAVQEDPEVRAVAERYGRVLSWDVAHLQQ